MNIELITQAKINYIYKRIFQNAEIIKGTVPFWTWSDKFVEDEFGKIFFKALKNPKSYYCIDISSTVTDIENIKSCCNKADNYYIYSYKYRSKKVVNEKTISLLHSKIMYVKTDLNHYVIIGSHNNTLSAYNGKNMEHSLLIEFPIKLTSEDEKLLNDILSQLDRIKSLCEKFDLKLVEEYKDKQLTDNIYYPMIILEVEPNHIKNFLPKINISVISDGLLSSSNEVEINIKRKNLLVAISVGKKIQKIFIANVVADDKVNKNEMNEKVTESDFIALNIKGLHDTLGIPYLAFKCENYQTIKGDKLNHSNHQIHRFKISEEIKSINLVKEFIGLNNEINIFTDIDEEDIKKLDILNKDFNIKDIVKIDKSKHNIEYLQTERNRAKNCEQEFNVELDLNIDSKNILNINNNLRKIFELLISDEIEVYKNKDFYKLGILEILADEKLNENEFYSDNTSDEILRLINKIKKNIETLKKDKNKKNKLKQFGGKYYISN